MCCLVVFYMFICCPIFERREQSRDAVQLCESISVGLQQRAPATSTAAAAAATTALWVRHAADNPNATDRNSASADGELRASQGNYQPTLQREISACGEPRVRLSHRRREQPPHCHANRVHQSHQCHQGKQRLLWLLGRRYGSPIRPDHCHHRLACTYYKKKQKQK